MIEIGKTIVSFQLFEECFACDLTQCYGRCCFEGDAGAPVCAEEIPIINQLLPVVWNDLTQRAQQMISNEGITYHDTDGETVLSIVDGGACVFAFTDEGGHYRCALEKAYHSGRSTFPKPISCHLYPVRIVNYKEFTAVNLHRWNVCDCAYRLGQTQKLPVYKFLKEPLIRRFGRTWYTELEQAAALYEQTFR